MPFLLVIYAIFDLKMERFSKNRAWMDKIIILLSMIYHGKCHFFREKMYKENHHRTLTKRYTFLYHIYFKIAIVFLIFFEEMSTKQAVVFGRLLVR